MGKREIYPKIVYKELLHIRANCDDPKKVLAHNLEKNYQESELSFEVLGSIPQYLSGTALAAGDLQMPAASAVPLTFSVSFSN